MNIKINNGMCMWKIETSLTWTNLNWSTSLWNSSTLILNYEINFIKEVKNTLSIYIFGMFIEEEESKGNLEIGQDH